MKAGTPELMKFHRLQRRLGETKRGLVGLLELLWQATAKNAPAGDIGRFTNEEIAILCDWEGDPDGMITALIETGWLDESTPHRLVVHDWSAHCPSYVKGNMAKYDRPFADAPYEAPKDTPYEAPKEHPIGDSPGDGPTKPNLTKPSVVVVGGSDQQNGKDPAWLVKLRAVANHTPLSRDLVERIGVSVALKLTPAQAAIGLVPTFDPKKGKVKDATAYLSKVCRAFEEKYDGEILTRTIAK